MTSVSSFKATPLKSTDFEALISKCPKFFGPEGSGHDRSYLNTCIRSGKTLLQVPLDELVEAHFPSEKIKFLSKHRHNQEDYKKSEVTIKNSSFHVVIGTKESYDRMFNERITRGATRSHPAKGVYVKSNIAGAQREYQDLFADFFCRMFVSNEQKFINDSFERDDVITISIFARQASKTKGLSRWVDHLIAAASFPNDLYDSLLLAWIGVIDKSLAELKIHQDFKNCNSPIRSQYDIGRFLLCIAQVFQSVVAETWCPIICQVHGIKERGPYNFYAKNFFVHVPDYLQIVYDQSLFRNDFVINNDSDLVWMVLYYPLIDLLMFECVGKITWDFFMLIVYRGYFYFLRRSAKNSRPNNLSEKIRKNYEFGTELINSNKATVLLDKSVIEEDEDLAVSFIDDEKNQYLVAGTIVFNNLFSNAKEKEDCIYLDASGTSLIEETQDSLFISASKVIYGSSQFYVNLKGFLSFFYRSLAKLPKEHPYFLRDEFKEEIVSMFEKVLEKEIVPIVHQTDDEETTDKKRRLYILHALALRVTENDYLGSFEDLSIFGSIFQIEFYLLEAKSTEVALGDLQDKRTWVITRKSLPVVNSVITKLLKEDNSDYQDGWIFGVNSLYYMSLSTQNPEKFIEDNQHFFESIGQYTETMSKDLSTNVAAIVEESSIHSSEMDSFLIKNELSDKKLQKQFNKHIELKEPKKYLNKGKQWLTANVHMEIGPILEFLDFEQAGVPDEFIMTCTRVMDPFAILIQKNVWPIQGKCQFQDLFRLRRKTRLNKIVTKLFVEYLESINDDMFFVDAASYDENIRYVDKMLKFCRRFDKAPNKDIILVLPVDDIEQRHPHDNFILVCIRRSNPLPTTKNDDADPVYAVELICSMDLDLDELKELCQDQFLHVFLRVSMGHSFEYRIMKSVNPDTGSNLDMDSGIIALQNMYSEALKPNNIPPALLQTTVFRAFVLYKILEYNKRRLSPFIHFQENSDSIEISQDSTTSNRKPMSDSEFQSFIPESDTMDKLNNPIETTQIEESSQTMESEENNATRTDMLLSSELDQENDCKKSEQILITDTIQQPAATAPAVTENDKEFAQILTNLQNQFLGPKNISSPVGEEKTATDLPSKSSTVSENGNVSIQQVIESTSSIVEDNFSNNEETTNASVNASDSMFLSLQSVQENAVDTSNNQSSLPLVSHQNETTQKQNTTINNVITQSDDGNNSTLEAEIQPNEASRITAQTVLPSNKEKSGKKHIIKIPKKGTRNADANDKGVLNKDGGTQRISAKSGTSKKQQQVEPAAKKKAPLKRKKKKVPKESLQKKIVRIKIPKKRILKKKQFLLIQSHPHNLQFKETIQH